MSAGTARASLNASRAALAAALGVFFCSGFAALLYQVIWQRMLVLFAGGDIHSVTIIVSAFMAGLGLGSLAGGHVADRVAPRTTLWLFVGAELAIGVFGLLSEAVYYDVLHTRLAFLSGSPLGTGLLFVSLLWPTFFMGAALPLLARGLMSSVAAAGSVVGALYGWNTLGAAVGAVATTWVLLPSVGLSGALLVGAGLNAICAVGGLVVGVLAQRTQRSGPTAASVETSEAREPGLSFAAWAVLFGVTGAVALALEVVWFRILGVMLKSTAFTFGTLLGIYLGGLGLGALAGSWGVRRSRAPGVTFLSVQVAIVVVTGLLVVVLVRMLDAGRPPGLVEHLADFEYEVSDGVAALVDWWSGDIEAAQWSDLRRLSTLYVVLPAALFLVPTMLMGFGFPYLQHAAQRDASRIGRRVGVLMASNVVGSALGAAATGLVLLPLIGTAATLRLVVAAAIVPAVLLARQGHTRTAGLAGAVALATAAFLPNSASLWASMHGTTDERILVAEDGAGISLLKADGESFEGRTWVFVNGLSQSWIPYGNNHTSLGALPAFIHPNPEDVAIIGLGSGDTAFSAAGRSSVRSVVCIEIVGGQRRVLEGLLDVVGDPGLASFLADRRVEHVVGDGRAYLRRSERRFDIIEADALRHFSAYSGNLYSVEYFELVRSRLRPFGLAVTWAPTDRIKRTFLRVFPHVLAFADDIHIGSNEPIAFDPEVVKARLADVQVRQYYERAGIDIQDNLMELLDTPPDRFDTRYDRSALNDLNRDLFPRDEFELPF